MNKKNKSGLWCLPPIRINQRQLNNLMMYNTEMYLHADECREMWNLVSQHSHLRKKKCNRNRTSELLEPTGLVWIKTLNLLQSQKENEPGTSPDWEGLCFPSSHTPSLHPPPPSNEKSFYRACQVIWYQMINLELNSLGTFKLLKSAENNVSLVPLGNE